MSQRRSASKQDGLWARAANLILAGWLFLSAFAWDHAPAERVNTAYVGLFVFASALAAVTRPRARNLTTALALWLLVSLPLLPNLHPATAWNNASVALAVFLLSLRGPRQAPPSRALDLRELTSRGPASAESAA